MPKKNSHDPKCADLAEYFLNADATNKQVSELAQVIQDAIEDWLFEMEIIKPYRQFRRPNHRKER